MYVNISKNLIKRDRLARKRREEKKQTKKYPARFAISEAITLHYFFLKLLFLNLFCECMRV